MTSTIGSVATTTIVAKGFRHARFVTGDLSEAAAPGTAFARTAIANVFTVATTTHTLKTLFYVEFRPRTTSTFGEVNINATEAATVDARLLDVTASGDDIEWWIKTEDMGEDNFAGEGFVANSKGFLQQATSALVSSSKVQCRVAPNYRYVNGDTVCKVCKP